MRWMCVLLLAVMAGCGGDPNANVKAITPELTAEIAAEDRFVNDEEGGKGAVRN